MTIGQEPPTTLKQLFGRMTELGITSSKIEGAIGGERLQVSKVTLALLLRMRLQEGERLAHIYGCQALQRAIDGLSSSGQAYVQAELTSAALARELATCEMWLTQCATITGFLVGSGVPVPMLRSFRTQRVEILFTSDLLDLIDAVEYTIREQRARMLTLWALGAGKFNSGTDLETMWRKLYAQEGILRNGWRYT